MEADRVFLHVFWYQDLICWDQMFTVAQVGAKLVNKLPSLSKDFQSQHMAANTIMSHVLPAPADNSRHRMIMIMIMIIIIIIIVIIAILLQFFRYINSVEF